MDLVEVDPQWIAEEEEGDQETIVDLAEEEEVQAVRGPSLPLLDLCRDYLDLTSTITTLHRVLPEEEGDLHRSLTLRKVQNRSRMLLLRPTLRLVEATESGFHLRQVIRGGHRIVIGTGIGIERRIGKEKEGNEL